MRAIILQSFGSSRTEAYEKSIGKLREEVKKAYPEDLLIESFSSEMVRRILSKRGVDTRNMPESLKYLDEKSIKDILVLSLYVIEGVEYEKTLKQGQDHNQDGGLNINFTSPLLVDENDLERLAQALVKEFEGRTSVLMGHGSYHKADKIYEDLQKKLDEKGAKIYIGTAEGSLGIDDIKKRLADSDDKLVTLAPLLLVAGVHAEEDIADDQDPDSWFNQIKSMGKEVELDLRGLCERDLINEIFMEKLGGLA